MVLEIPEILRQYTIQREGGAAWLTSLPALVDDLLQRWNTVPAGPAISGKVGIVIPARSTDHGDVVLKVSIPHPFNMYEPDAYAAWQGRGAVALLERDDKHFAMLLERVGPGKPHEGLAVDDAIAVAGRLSRRLAVPAPPHLPRVCDQAQTWLEVIGRASNRLPASVVDAAGEAVRDLCLDQPDTMVHGDLHFNNILRGVRESWQVIDPKGMVGDPASDAHTVLRTAAIHLLGPGEDVGRALRRWITIFAEAAELGRDHVRRWAQARAVTHAQSLCERNAPPAVREAHDKIASLLT